MKTQKIMIPRDSLVKERIKVEMFLLDLTERKIVGGKYSKNSITLIIQPNTPAESRKAA